MVGRNIDQCVTVAYALVLVVNDPFTFQWFLVKVSDRLVSKSRTYSCARSHEHLTAQRREAYGSNIACVLTNTIQQLPTLLPTRLRPQY